MFHILCIYGDKWLNTMTKLGPRSYHQQDDKLNIERENLTMRAIVTEKKWFGREKVIIWFPTEC